MNAAAHSRMPALERAPSPAPRFNPFADPVPATLYDLISRSIGEDAADKLIADFGGRRLYIPIAPGPTDLIARSIGLVAALAMAHTFGSDRLLIPVSSTHNRRRVRIVAMRAEHVSISHIARELRCTERYVYKVLALHRAPEPAAAAPVAPTSAPIAERLKRGLINRRS
jgi:Homeodomain-like domain